MRKPTIADPSTLVKLETWKLSGEGVTNIEKRIKDLKGVFVDETAWSKMDPEMLVYQVQSHMPVREGTPGGLFYGTTIIHPGKTGAEYFMTRGHFHAVPDRAEYYWGIQGEGILILMDMDRNSWAEKVSPGSLHYIGGYTAHRVANIGKTPLIFGACWPSDAGHNYEEIQKNGFSARLLEVNGNPELVNSKL